MLAPRRPPLACALLLLLIPASDGCSSRTSRTETATTPPLRTSPGPYRPIPLTLLTVTPHVITVQSRFRSHSPTRPTGPAEQAYTLDPAQTQVFRHTVTSERQMDDGRIALETTLTPASLADLHPGQLLHVSATDSGVARDIIILHRPATTRPATRRSD